MAVGLNPLPAEGFNVIIAAALVSIMLNPLMLRAVRARRGT
jgi:predicted Kef-type K+ transport protein